MAWENAELTCDAFLGGQVHLFQPQTGFRAGVDTVMLAAAVPAVPGQTVLDLGCGVGGAALCLGTRIAGLEITGIELQPDYADLARRNAAHNAVTLEVVTADVSKLPAGVRARRFDHVIANPPYYDRIHGAAAADKGREMAHGGDLPLAEWVKAASKRLAPKGQFHMIQRIERLPEVIEACMARLGDIEVLPIVSRAGRDPERFILRARKGGRGPFRLCPALVMHVQAAHVDGPRDYAQAVNAVLRDGAPLNF